MFAGRWPWATRTSSGKSMADCLTGAGAELDVVRPDKADLPEPDGYLGVVCLGGEMGANDDLQHPWLADVRRLLAGAVSRRLPVLAICLGGQLLATAMGGRV